MSPQDFDDIPGLLHDAGYDPTAIGKTIHSYFNKPADVAAGYMKQFGAGADVVANVLKGDYGLNADDAAKILEGVLFPMSAILPVLGSVFGVAASGVAAILKFAGFDPGDVDDFLGGLADLACELNPLC